MAFETITVGTLRTQLARKLNNSDTLDSSLTTEATFALHAAFRDLIRESQGEGAVSVTATPITLVAGTALYGMEDDVFMLIEESFRITTSPWYTLQPLSRQQYDALQLASQQATGYPTHYMIEGASSSTGKIQVRFHPTPNSACTGKFVTYDYVATLPSLLTAEASTTLDKRCPPAWHHFLVCGALTYMPQYFSDADKRSFSIKWEEHIRAARRTAWPSVGWADQREQYRSSQGRRMFAPLSSWPLSP